MCVCVVQCVYCCIQACFTFNFVQNKLCSQCLCKPCSKETFTHGHESLNGTFSHTG